MAIIKNLVFCPGKILKKTALINYEMLNSAFPFGIVNSLLPLKFKFLKESFAVIDNNKICAVVTLEKDDSNEKRLKISQVAIEENCAKFGELLISHCVSNFFSRGAESFCISVNQEDFNLIKLFTDSCNFRIACDEFLFKVKKSDFNYEKENCFSFIRFSKNSEVGQISSLYNSMIFSHLAPVFQIKEKYFRENLFVGLNGKIVFGYVLENADKKELFGHFTISTENNKEFVLEAVLPSGYEVYMTDVLRFARHEISKRTNVWTLYVKIRSCFVNFREFLNIMDSYDLKCVQKSKILIKDMYKPAKSDLLSGKQIIFNDITPAY